MAAHQGERLCRCADARRLSLAEQQARYRADVERMLDETVFPVLRRHGMEVGWNRSLATRVHVTGARWYAPLP